jgi:hypothetical protein
MTNLSQCLTEAGRNPLPFWRYDFPNGYYASVIVYPHLESSPFTFEVLTDALAKGHDVLPGLTTDQVVETLTVISQLPAPEPGEEKPVDIRPATYYNPRAPHGAPPVRTYVDGRQTRVPW